jgi:hypothetical protein
MLIFFEVFKFEAHSAFSQNMQKQSFGPARETAKAVEENNIL